MEVSCPWQREATHAAGRAAFPQLRRPSFLGPGPDTDSEDGPDEAFRRDGFDAPRPPPPAQPSSSASGRIGEAVLRGGEAVIAAGASGIGQAVRQFGFRNAELAAAAVERRALPQIIGRPAEAEQLIARAGQRAQEVERAAAQDIETFAAEQAAAEGGELVPLLAETGTQTAEAVAAEAAGGGILGGLAAAGGAAAEGAGAAAAAAFPIAEGLGMAAGVATGGAAALAGGAAYGLYQGGRWLLSGNGGDAASSSGGEFPDVRTLNGMQQGTPQERISLQQPRVQQPMVSRLKSSEDDAPMAQQQAQPRPQVQSRPAPQPRMPFGLNQISQPSSGSDSYAPVRRPRAQRPEPSFNELRREALSREPEAA